MKRRAGIVLNVTLDAMQVANGINRGIKSTSNVKEQSGLRMKLKICLIHTQSNPAKD